MSEAADRELEEEVRALLRPAREPQAAPAEVKARALRRLALALPVPGGGAGGSGGEGVPPAPGAPGLPSRLGRALAARVPAWSLPASFLAGAAVALLATARATAPLGEAPRSAPKPPVTLSAPPGEAPSDVAPSHAETAAAPVPLTSAAAHVSSVPRPPLVPAAPSIAPAGAGGDGLEAERAVLDVGRTALGRGDGGNALRATEEHGRRFPRGILAEEREAMSIQALRLLHRDGEAQDRLERFRGRFPTSLIRPALEATDGATP